MYSEEKDFVSNYKEFKKSKIKHHDNVSTGEILTYRKKYYELTKKENRKLMDKIDKIGNANSPKAQKMQNEMKCNDFKSKMLENGWSPVDLPVLDEMYQTAQKLTNPQHKDSAKAYIDAMMNSVVANKEAKYTLVREVTKNFPQNIRQSIRNELVRVNQKYPPTDMEHKGTNELKQKFFSSADANVTFEKDGFNVEVLKKQQAETKAHQAPENTQQRKQLRNKKDYVVPQQTAEELAAHTRNESEKNFNIKTTVSQAVQKTFLNAHLANPYNKINDIRLNPDQQRRTVDIHYSRGTAQFQSGENVLEIDFAGSGFANPRKAAKGFNGEIKDVEMSDEEALRAQYGEIREDYPYAKPADSKNPLTKNYVRHKTEEAVVNGRRVTKERISIPGPLAKDFAFDLMPVVSRVPPTAVRIRLQTLPSMPNNRSLTLSAPIRQSIRIKKYISIWKVTAVVPYR